ncbi:MAG TPA: plastocyanin/azurin family copper-binding protein [Thermoleophilaceae bacterium]|nr:plastocyanin/azurin family copper-binding protein [Thermoleophilaceae bacterium]
MRRWPTAFALVALLLALFAVPAGAAQQTKSFDYPVDVDPFEVEQSQAILNPKIDGFITGMSVDVVNADGTQVPIERLMLHHIVFARLGVKHPGCNQLTAFDSKTKLPAAGEPFYAAGEERQVLALPPGYGYRVSEQDAWYMTWMLMNHRGAKDNAMIRYTITYDDSPDLKPVRPLWMDVVNCKADPVYDVPGGGKPGSVHERRYDLVAPQSGRIVAGGGHVHGGGIETRVSQPECGDREVMSSKPAWGMPDHPFYTVRPILHEPGPISMSGWLSSQGHPVRQGQRIRLTSRYDNSRPHTRVMGINLIYLAPGEVGEDCAPAPTDAINVQPADVRGEPYRTKTPKFTVPLTGADAKGRAVSISRPPGKTRTVKSGATVKVGDNFFSIPNAAVRKGSKLRWSFGTPTLHNVTLANGPRGFSSDNLSDGRRFDVKFKVPGTYRLMCTLHPIGMTQTVTVR